MARFEGLEAIIDKILVELAANLPAELLAREAGPGGAGPNIALPAPAAGEYKYGARQIHTTYPAVECFPVLTPIVKDGADTLITQGNIGLAIFVRDGDEGTLWRKVERYGWAVWQVLANRRSAGAFSSMTPPVTLDLNEGDPFDWFPSRVPNRTILQTDVMFAIRATKAESRT